MLAQERVLEVPHPGLGTVRMTGFPVKLNKTPATLRRPSPALGEHTEKVFASLGYRSEQIEALVAMQTGEVNWSEFRSAPASATSIYGGWYPNSDQSR